MGFNAAEFLTGLFETVAPVAEIPSDVDAGLSIDLQPQGQTATEAAGWILPPWPPVVDPRIIADPIPICSDCGRGRVIPGQPGRSAGLCWECWSGKAISLSR